MNKRNLPVIIGIIVAFGGILVIYPMVAIPDRSNLEAYCEDIGGDWWTEESVCRSISDEQCELYGGTPNRIGLEKPEGVGLEGVVTGFIAVCDLSVSKPANIDWKLEDYTVNDCQKVKKDENGFLEKICRYILENKIGGAGDPTKYDIVHVFEDVEYKGKDVYYISLDCCYTGDVAFVDKKTKEVIGFSLGGH